MSVSAAGVSSGTGVSSAGVSGAGVAGGVTKYTPLATWSAAGGTNGSLITGWAARTGDLRYSNAISGPFGGSIVGSESVLAGAVSYGGAWIRDRSPVIASIGDTIWFRIYAYFATNFAFNYGTVPADGSGNAKFIRFEDNSGDPGGRYTFQLAVDPVASGTRTSTTVVGATDEVNSIPNLNDFFSPTPANYITRGAWHSIEVSMKVADATTNNGYIRAWIDDIYLGEVTSVDNVTNGAAINDLIIGNYWNGSFTQNGTWYFDEFILTTQTPTAKDSGGRSFIGAAKKVSDF